jgi:hypothetical protein
MLKGGNMLYCHKCGAELAEDAKFCHVCGTPVGVPVAPRYERVRKRAPVTLPAIILIAILLAGMIFAAFVFLPFNPVNFGRSEGVTYQQGIDMLDLNFSADVARVNITFEHLVSKLVTLNVSATGGVGIFASRDPVNVTFTSAFSSNVLTVTSKVETTHGLLWYPWLNVVCDLRIDTSLSSSLNVKTTVGRIILNTRAGVVLNSLSLEATTGGIEVGLVKDVTVRGNILAKSTTGAVRFSWDNVKAPSNVSVNAETTTGSVALNVLQNETMPANVTMNAQTTTGGVDLTIAIHDDVGARIESTVTTGGIHVGSQVGFSGTKSPLQSTNYPTSSNFAISLKTTTGGINIDAKYALGDSSLF